MKNFIQKNKMSIKEKMKSENEQFNKKLSFIETKSSVENLRDFSTKKSVDRNTN